MLQSRSVPGLLLVFIGLTVAVSGWHQGQGLRRGANQWFSIT